jgi:hypothetical protein
MKKSNKILMIGLITTVISIVGVIWGFSSAEAMISFRPQPSPTPEVLENGWYRFADQDAGYSITYPSNAYLSATTEAGLTYQQIVISFPTSNSSDVYSIQIIVYANEERLSIVQTIREKIYMGKSHQDDVLNLESVRIAGLDAKKVTILPFDPAIFIEAKGKIYFISLSYDMLSGNPPTPEAIDLFYEIVETFSIE